jgi:hypothetical protein
MGAPTYYNDAATISVPSPASTLVTVGDLLFNNSGTLAKASAQADQLTAAANQKLFAKLFLGIAAEAKIAADSSTRNVLVRADVVARFDCASTTWTVGDLIGAVENTGGDALENQKVAKVTDPEAAIGVCVEAATSATTVKGHFFSRYAPPGLSRGLSYVSYYFTGTPAATDQAFFVAPYPCRVVAVAEVHSAAAGGASTIQVVKDTSTNAPGAGTDLLSSAFDLNATANTTQQGALSSTASDLVLAAGDRLSVDFANAIQSTAGVCVTVAIAPITPG